MNKILVSEMFILDSYFEPKVQLVDSAFHLCIIAMTSSACLG